MTNTLPKTAGRSVETDPRSSDHRLRGRTYAIPFERVWTEALALADGGLRGWRVLESDDRDGLIVSSRTTFLFRRVTEVRIEIGLDENAQTRVDVRATYFGSRPTFGAEPRLIASFIRRLDARLGADESQILDPTKASTWSS